MKEYDYRERIEPDNSPAGRLEKAAVVLHIFSPQTAAVVEVSNSRRP